MVPLPRPERWFHHGDAVAAIHGTDLELGRHGTNPGAWRPEVQTGQTTGLTGSNGT